VSTVLHCNHLHIHYKIFAVGDSAHQLIRLTHLLRSLPISMSNFTFSYPVPPRDPNWGQFGGVVDPNTPAFSFTPPVPPPTPVLPVYHPLSSEFRHTDLHLQPSDFPLSSVDVETVPTAALKASKSKPKPKQKAAAVVFSVDDEVLISTKRGRRAGSGNYNDMDTKALLKYVEAELPLGPRGWRSIHSKFKKWARDHQRPDRESKSLETKFKQVSGRECTPTSLTIVHQLVKITKPTGSGVRPPNVAEALRIEALINERAETCHLKDGDFCDEEGEGVEVVTVESSDDDSNDEASTQKVTAHISRVDATKPSRPTRGARGPMDVIEKLTQALDPAVQQARDEQRSSNALHTTQFLMLSQQLRDSHATNEALRSQIMDLKTQAVASELKLELSQRSKLIPRSKYHAPRSSPSQRKRRRRPDSDGGLGFVTETDANDSKENSPDSYYHNRRAARYRKLMRPPLLRTPHKHFPSIYHETPTTSPISLSSSPSLPSPSAAFIRKRKSPFRDIVNEPETTKEVSAMEIGA